MPNKFTYGLIRMALPVCCLVACADSAGPPSSDGESVTGKASGTTTATIEYTLPADGCAFVVHIQDAEYAPDASSLAALRERVPAYGMTSVQVEYKLTGRTGRVECGFNTHRDLLEVALVVKDS